MAHSHHHTHHNHDHSHGHDHGHHHHHGTGNIKVAFFLNLGFCIIEFVGGFLTNSISIMSDALHDLGDSFSLGLAWYFQKVSAKKRDQTFSYGYRRFSLLGAIINSVVLLIGSIFILREAIPRIIHPEAANAKGMLWFAIFGILVNGAAMLRLKKGGSLNEEAMSLHFLEDVLGWVAVLIVGIVMLFANIPQLDPILSVLITCYILFNVYKNLKRSMSVFLQAVPVSIDQQEIKRQILAIENVVDIHDLHVWTMDGTYNVMTVHVVISNIQRLEDSFLLKQKIKKQLKNLPIQHITVEIEGEAEKCGLEEC